MLDVIDDFELSVTVVNVVSGISGYILRNYWEINASIQVLRLFKNADWHQQRCINTRKKLLLVLCMRHLQIVQFSWKVWKGISNKYSQSYGFEGHLINIVEVCIHDIVPSRVSRLCPKYKDGEYIKFIAKLYFRCHLHYYLRNCLWPKPRKIGRLKFLSTNENRHI